MHSHAGLDHDAAADGRAWPCAVLADYTSSTVVDCAGRTAFDVGFAAPSKQVKDVFDERLLVLRCFLLHTRVHCSDHCLVFHASEVKNKMGQSHDIPRAVALKFMLFQDQFERELQARKKLHLHIDREQRFVIDVIDHYEHIELERLDLKTHMGSALSCLRQRVLDDAIRHDNLAGKTSCIEDVRHIMRQLARALQFLHMNGLIQGDVKPLNAMA